MNLKYFLIGLILLSTGCSKDEEIPEIKNETKQEIIKDESTYEIIDLNIKKELLFNSKTSLFGYGFDAKINKIALNEGIRNEVIDYNSLTDNQYNFERTRQGSGHYRESSTKQEILNLLHINNDNSIGKVEYLFDFEKELPEKNISFFTYNYKLNSFELYSDRLKTKNYSENFLNDLNLLTAAEMVKKYGTHIISHFSTGYNVTTISFVNKETIDENIRTKHWKRLVFAAGADVSKISTKANEIYFDEFTKSYDESKTMFIKLNTEETQLPIYELLEESEKKEALKSYIKEYLK